MLGRQLILAFGGAVVASSVTCEVEMQTDTIEVASPTSGVFRDYIASLCGWSISTSGLIKTTQQQHDLFELWRNRTKLRVNYYDTEMRMVRSGYAIITNLRESAPNRSIPTYSISLQGCGELKTIEYSSIVTPSSFNSNVQDVHIAFAANENGFITPNNHFFEQQKSANIFSWGIGYTTGLTRFKLTYYSGTPEVHPIILVARFSGSEAQDVDNTIKALDTLKFVNQYEVAHFGGTSQNHAIVKDLLIPPGKFCRLFTDSDMALGYVTVQTLTLPTS